MCKETLRFEVVGTALVTLNIVLQCVCYSDQRFKFVNSNHKTLLMKSENPSENFEPKSKINLLIEKRNNLLPP